MKKIAIVVVVILVVVLGFGFMSFMSEKGLSDAADKARVAAISSGLRSFVLYGLVDMATYYDKNKNGPSYWSVEANKKAMDAKFDELVRGRNTGEFSYNVFDEKENGAVKAADLSRGMYVCVDSISVSVKDISSDEFAKKTDCSGQILK